MERTPEAVTGKTLAGFIVLATVLGLFAAPIALWVGPSGQPTVLRITVALFCAVIACRLIRVVKEAALVGQQTLLDIAEHPHIPSVQVDPLLTRLAKEMRPGIGLRIDTTALWERVEQLCLQRGVSTADMPASGRSQQDIERIIQQLEDAT
jgi:hypothetical protein